MDHLFKSVTRLGCAISAGALQQLGQALPLITGPAVLVASSLSRQAPDFDAGPYVGCASAKDFRPDETLFGDTDFTNVLGPRYFIWAAWQACKPSMDFAAQAAHISPLSPQWEELRNKIDAFSLFEHVDLELKLAAGADRSLAALVRRAQRLGPYYGVWATEGIGHYYADSHLSRGRPIDALLSNQQSHSLPEASLVPLHAGIGLALAEALLADIDRLGSSQTKRRVSDFVKLCRDAFQSEYVEIIYEALGLAARNLYPHLISTMHTSLSATSEELPDFFWHGVGRALYFSPSTFLSCPSAQWKAFRMCMNEPPDQLRRRNALAGFAWALTLVNIREPRIMAAFLNHHGENMVEQDAFANGVCSALIIWAKSSADTSDLTRLKAYRCNETNPSPVHLWSTYIGEACRNALAYCNATNKTPAAGKLFRYQPSPWPLNSTQGDKHSATAPAQSDSSG
jgi:hypothetical protein